MRLSRGRQMAISLLADRLLQSVCLENRQELQMWKVTNLNVRNGITTMQAKNRIEWEKVF